MKIPYCNPLRWPECAVWPSLSSLPWPVSVGGVRWGSMWRELLPVSAAGPGLCSLLNKKQLEQSWKARDAL